MARIPNSLKIGPYVYDIKIMEELKTEFGTPLWGECDNRAQVIRIEKTTQEGRKAVIAIHEVLHALLDVIDYHPKDEAEGEKLVVTLAPVLTQFIKDNPKLMEYIRNV